MADDPRAVARRRYKEQHGLGWDEANALWVELPPGSDRYPFGISEADQLANDQAAAVAEARADADEVAEREAAERAGTPDYAEPTPEGPPPPVEGTAVPQPAEPPF